MSIRNWLLVALLVGLAMVLVAGVETSAHHISPPRTLQPDCRYNAPTRTTVCGVPPMRRRVTEDSPDWNCNTMGNHVCGPVRQNGIPA